MVTERERRMAVLGPHVFDGVPLARAAADAGVPRRTAARWLLAYAADGSTARSGRSDRTRRRRIPVELVTLIEGLALRRPPPKIAQVHREAVRIAEEKGWSAPSYPVVYRIVADLDRGLVSLAHKGAAAYGNDFDLVLRRESTNANDLWQADHTQLDVIVLDESDRPVRPWLTVILDDKSRAVAGYTVFLGDPTSLQAALALRQAIWRKSDPAWPVCGLPSALYSDHGADFTSDHIAQVCADLKVQLIHSTHVNWRFIWFWLKFREDGHWLAASTINVRLTGCTMTVPRPAHPTLQPVLRRTLSRWVARVQLGRLQSR